MIKELTARQKNVLSGIIKHYIKTATPVSSRHVVMQYKLDCSSATVRNEMVNLEEMGLIKQPHTSAGRIPADEGYRIYVDSLMKKEKLSSQEREEISERIEKSKGDLNLILEDASRIMGKISKELSVVLTPWISWGIFDRLELIGLTERKVLAIIHVRSRLVKTVILELESDLKQEDIEKTTLILNERLSGLTLEEIQQTIGNRIRDTQRGDRMLLQRIAESASSLFNFSEHLDVHTCGTQNILSQPEFSDTSKLETILNLIDNRKILIHLFHRKVKDTEVNIGFENKDRMLHSFTVITARYTRGKDEGTLGVIGPTRMRYSKIVPLVGHMAKTMSEFLS